MSGKGKGKTRYAGKGALGKAARGANNTQRVHPPTDITAVPGAGQPSPAAPSATLKSRQPTRHVATLTLTIRAPFLFPGVAAGWFGVDRIALRNHDGQVIIPQDQVRGVLRDGLRLLGETEGQIEAVFGKESGDAKDIDAPSYAPLRGKLFFSDLVAKGTSASCREWHHRVRIDKESGAADEGHLLVDEQVVPAGAEIDFAGTITFFAADADVADIIAKLQAAMGVPLCIGAMKTVGFGEILKVTLIPQKPKRGPSPKADASRLTWGFTLDRSYLVDARRIADNAYLGSVDIPGAALKGLIARNLELRGVDIQETGLATALSQMRVGFGRPLRRSRAFPASIVFERPGPNDPGRPVDLAANGDLPSAPELQADWKEPDWDIARVALNEPENAALKIDERVHTKIDEITGGAKDELLFSTLAIVPAEMSATIDFTGVAEGPRRKIITVLEDGLVGLGRTGAILQTSSLNQLDNEEKPKAGRIAIRLVTNGLLAVPSDASDAKAAYGAFWKGKLPNSALAKHFASQSLVGGYIGQRFRTDGKYRPWMLTDAGAVFVFDLHQDDIDALQTLLQRGVCRTKLGGADLTWQNCPFVPENGFGEIALYQPHVVKGAAK